jgi:endonuclease I
MKKIFYYFSLLLAFLTLASCQADITLYDVYYYIDYKLVTTEKVNSGGEVYYNLNEIVVYSKNTTMEGYINSILSEGDEFDYWYTDVGYKNKVDATYKVTSKTSLYGKVIKAEGTNPEPTPTPNPNPTPVQLDTPNVSISTTGLASWSAVANASGYKYQIDSQTEKVATGLSVQLQDGQSIKVKAIGDGTNFTDSNFSATKTYNKPSSGPTVPGDTNGDGTLDKIETYYLSAYNLNGDALKKALHQITETTHTKQLTYKECWDAIGKADKGSKSNTVICVYTGVEFNVTHRDGGSSGASVVWNREHVWPNSKGFGNQSYTAYSDVHHLFASEKGINNTRGNKDFGEVSSSATKDSYGNYWTSSYFEPRDEVKGDLARALFYMLVRYDGDTCGNCTLDLELVVGSSSSYSNVIGKNGYLGDLAILIKWHYEDPVCDRDRTRNEVVYGIQGNRNPFIDHPEYIALLYPELAAQYA